MSGDNDTALRILGPLAEAGDRYAQDDVGLMFFKGYGVAQDFSQAVFWFRRSANQGTACAQCHLGLCYQDGLGVPQDSLLAYMWFSLAARQGISKAKTAQFEYAAQLTSAQIAEAQKLIREWLAKHPRN